MAKMFIAEFSAPARNRAGGDLQVAKEPARALQVVTFSNPTASAGFQDSVLRMISDTDCYMLFNKAGQNDTADTTSQFVPANTVEWREVEAGMTVSVYDGTSTP